MSAISRLSNEYAPNQRQDCKSIKPRAHIVSYHTQAALQSFQMPNWKWFRYIE